MKVVGLLVCFFACLPVVAQDVIINELQSSNELTIADEMGDYDDWIELLNISAAAIDLSGWSLQEVEGSTFVFPDDENFQLEPGEQLNIPVKTLGKGQYFIVIRQDGKQEAGGFVKL